MSIPNNSKIVIDAFIFDLNRGDFYKLSYKTYPLADIKSIIPSLRFDWANAECIEWMKPDPDQEMSCYISVAVEYPNLDPLDDEIFCIRTTTDYVKTILNNTQAFACIEKCVKDFLNLNIFDPKLVAQAKPKIKQIIDSNIKKFKIKPDDIVWEK